MTIYTKEEFMQKKDQILRQILSGAVFIYPTDTIYGIGCNATDGNSVKRIRALKHRPDMPFSVIAPSKDWIRENCIIPSGSSDMLDKLPGPYTFILELKEKPVSDLVNLSSGTLGVRIPDHWISKIVEEAGIPIITTSANITGRDFMTEIRDLDESMLHGVDFIIDSGRIAGRPSTIINLTGEEPVFSQR